MSNWTNFKTYGIITIKYIKNISVLTAARVRSEDRKDFRYCLQALKDMMELGQMPFLDLILTDGVIEQIVANCGRFKSEKELDIICGGLSDELKREIMILHEEIF